MPSTFLLFSFGYSFFSCYTHVLYWGQLCIIKWLTLFIHASPIKTSAAPVYLLHILQLIKDDRTAKRERACVNNVKPCHVPSLAWSPSCWFSANPVYNNETACHLSPVSLSFLLQGCRLLSFRAPHLLFPSPLSSTVRSNRSHCRITLGNGKFTVYNCNITLPYSSI